jgi:hypothetical protein
MARLLGIETVRRMLGCYRMQPPCCVGNSVRSAQRGSFYGNVSASR